MQTLEARQVLLLDAGWKFHLGDTPSPVPADKHIAAYMANKAGWARGAARANYDDTDWRTLDLPHDWSVEGKFDPSNYLDNGFLPRGIGWYRRHFQLDTADRGKYLAIQFDGVSSHCTVYVNGHVVHRNFCGYTPFTIDISDIARFGDEINTIAVRVDATPIEGWWYEGAGIYRHVWLIRGHSTHLASNGVFIHAAPTEADKWSTRIEITVQNESYERVECEIYSGLVDPSHDIGGHEVAGTRSQLSIGPREMRVTYHVLEISKPTLWSVDEPFLYNLNTVITIGGRVVDLESTPFGYRTIRFDPDHGFFLNDKPLKLKGTCNHQDHAGVGVAVPDSIHEFRIRRLKEMGCNAYRTAHNPPASELLDACDRLGMLVMDENRTFGSSPEHLAQLRSIVRRDRNHPSVILWSICNEEAIQGTPVAANIARAMQHEVKQLDPSRPVTAGVSGGILNDDCIADVIEVMGLNYQLPLNDQYHAKHPRTPLFAAETHCVLSTRSTYETNPQQHYFGSSDTDIAPWGATARETWRFVSSRPYIAGLFAWTGFDYRGEPTPHGWPCVNSHLGIMDMCGFPKDSFFLHKAFFTSDPFVHLFPHWNWHDREGAPIRVMVYSNCDEAELFLNDESLGRKRIDPIEMADWQVAYRPGNLRAVAYRAGRVVAEAMVETTGPAVGLGLEIHPSFDVTTIPADGHFALPITVFAVDAAGRRVPTADDHVTFSLSGPANILGVGNGDPTCHEPDKASARSLFRGLAQVIIQTSTTPGLIVLTATAPGRQSATLTLASSPCSPRDALPAARVRHFISDWRMSAVSAVPIGVGQNLIEQDMNSWDRIDPARGPQAAWNSASGYALYRATVTLPKVMQAHGGKIVFHEVIGNAQIHLNGVKAVGKDDPSPGPMEVPLKPSADPVVISVLLRSTASPGGLSRLVELLPPESAGKS